MKAVKFTMLITACLYLFGCASGANVQQMTYHGAQKTYAEPLQNNIAVTSTTGGSGTNPLWTSEISNEAYSDALKRSLQSQGLLSDNGQYQLSVKMLKVEQPLFGLDMRVTTHVQYTLTDKATNSIVLDETVIAPYTATIGDAFVAVTRLRMANEGSGKKNIEGLLAKLSALQINPGDISMAP
ncbi:MAG: hypothetical protein CVV16_02235 [Gammaproteobacteria bacterium HGW-Gammaproteobacteria-6]|nr:MAG: hypothetical protein CVV16_02235 [Gammaproteobacteria bacterium HGW-Gammaproteobacteria-6]